MGLDARSAILGLAALGAALWMGYAGIAGLGALIAGVRASASMVTVDTADAGLVLGIIMFGALALMLLHTAGPAPVRDRRNTRLFTLMLVGLPLMLAAPKLYGLAAASTLPGRGYASCPNPFEGVWSTSTNWRRGASAACPR